MMKNGFIAPNINFENSDEYSKNLNIVSATQNKDLNVVLSNSFGFGGTNSAIVIKGS
jgi:3-oxoacyl-[acyl-carrier-protein] synthase-1